MPFPGQTAKLPTGQIRLKIEYQPVNPHNAGSVVIPHSQTVQPPSLSHTTTTEPAHPDPSPQPQMTKPPLQSITSTTAPTTSPSRPKSATSSLNAIGKLKIEGQFEQQKKEKKSD
jgi:hypothetical protein